MKKVILFIIVFVTVYEIKSQINGLSPTYVFAYSPTSLDKNSLEFEPSFSIKHTNSLFDENAKIQKIDTNIFENEFGFRFTYGLLNRLEIGFFIPSMVNYSCFGLKINLLNKEKFGLAIIGGLNNDFETKNIWQQWGAGFAANYIFSEKIKSVFNSQYSHDFDLPTSKNIHFRLDNAFETNFADFVLSFLYDRYYSDNTTTESFQICPSIIFKGESFYATFYFPISIYGRNDNNYKSFGFALTIPMY